MSADPVRCASRRRHDAHTVRSGIPGEEVECPGYDPDDDPIGEVTSGRGLGRLFERKERGS